MRFASIHSQMRDWRTGSRVVITKITAMEKGKIVTTFQTQSKKCRCMRRVLNTIDAVVKDKLLQYREIDAEYKQCEYFDHKVKEIETWLDGLDDKQ